jgi:hypothetical protein
MTSCMDVSIFKDGFFQDEREFLIVRADMYLTALIPWYYFVQSPALLAQPHRIEPSAYSGDSHACELWKANVPRIRRASEFSCNVKGL